MSRNDTYSPPKRYAIAHKPVTMFDPYEVVAIVTSDTKPDTSDQCVAIELKGYYKCELGKDFGPECVSQYKWSDGTYTYVECVVDTSGT